MAKITNRTKVTFWVNDENFAHLAQAQARFPERSSIGFTIEHKVKGRGWVAVAQGSIHVADEPGVKVLTYHWKAYIPNPVNVEQSIIGMLRYC